MSRRLSDILDYAESLGYVDEGKTSGGHRRLRHRGTRRLVIVPDTPGRGRAVANAWAQLKRNARSEEAPPS